MKGFLLFYHLLGNKYALKVMDLAEIQHAIEELPKDQQTALAAWMAEREQGEWEAEIERDFAPAGAGMALIEEMKEQARVGKFRPFEQGPAHKR
jgi:hypothetical protein